MTFSIYWNTDTDGDWNTAADWHPARLPDSGDSVKIDTTDFHTITYSGGTNTVASLFVGNDAFAMTGGALTLSGVSLFRNTLSLKDATLTADDTTTVQGAFTEDSASTLAGTGGLILAAGGTLDGIMTGDATTLLQGSSFANALTVEDGRVLENRGALSFTSEGFSFSASLSLGADTESPGGTLQNDAGATLDIDVGTTIQGASPGAALVNAGNLNEESLSPVEINVPFTNTGHVMILDGLLTFGSTGSSSVNGFQFGARAMLEFTGGDSQVFTFTSGGTLGFDPTLLIVDGKTLDFEGNTNLGSALEATDGTIQGPGSLTLSDGGSFLDFTLAGNGVINFQSETEIDRQLNDSRLIANQGSLVFSNDGSHSASLDISGAGSGLINATGAHIEFEAPGVTNTIEGDSTSKFANAGTVENDVNTDVTSVISGLDFVNAGSVLVQFGEMDIDAHMSGSGTVEVDSGATFKFDGSSSALSDAISIASGAGLVSLTGGSGDDIFAFAGNLAATDKIDGGAGNDILRLNGDYSTGLNFTNTGLQNVETIDLVAGHSYTLAFNDGNVAAGATLSIFGASLGAGDALVVNGNRETDGSFVMKGGAGDDTLTGGAHGNTLSGGAGNDALTGGVAADSFYGGAGADTMTGNGGGDTFLYASAAESTGAGHDIIRGFDTASDHIDLKFAVTGIDAAVHGALSSATFDSDLASAVGAAQLGAHDALLFTASSGDLHGHVFLIIDGNGTAGYQAGADFVIDVTGGANLAGLSTANFI